MDKLAFALLVLALAPCAHARTLAISPANPTALELVHVTVDVIASCEDVSFRRFETNDGRQGTIALTVTRIANGVQCDDVDRFTLTLGAFPPGAYRVQTVLAFIDASPPVVDGQLDFVVTPAPASDLPRDRPQEDLSGIWVAAAEPFTGFAFIHSGGLVAGGGGRANRMTGLWYDYSGTTPTWTTLLLDSVNDPDRYTGQVTRAVPTGIGPERAVAFVPVGTATLRRTSPTAWRIDAVVEGRTFDFPIERFRYTRAAWPALR